jgi:hypothetical protein
MKRNPLYALEVEVSGRVYGKHPEDLNELEERRLVDFVAAEIEAINGGRRGLL